MAVRRYTFENALVEKLNNNYVVWDNSIVDHGDASTPGSFAWCINQIGANRGVISFAYDQNTYHFDTSVWVPENIEIIVNLGVRIYLDNCEIHFAGPFSAGNYRIFTFAGTGAVYFESIYVSEINTMWYGADPNESDNSVFINKAIASISNSGGYSGYSDSTSTGKIIRIESGDYHVENPIIIKSGINLIGRGETVSALYTLSDTTILQFGEGIGNVANWKVADLTLRGSSSGSNQNGMEFFGDSADRISHGLVENVQIKSFGKYGLTGTYLINTLFHKVNFSDFSETYIIYGNSNWQHVTFRDCRFSNSTNTGLGFVSIIEGNSITFDACSFYQLNGGSDAKLVRVGSNSDVVKSFRFMNCKFLECNCHNLEETSAIIYIFGDGSHYGSSIIENNIFYYPPEGGQPGYIIYISDGDGIIKGNTFQGDLGVGSGRYAVGISSNADNVIIMGNNTENLTGTTLDANAAANVVLINPFTQTGANRANFLYINKIGTELTSLGGSSLSGTTRYIPLYDVSGASIAGYLQVYDTKS